MARQPKKDLLGTIVRGLRALDYLATQPNGATPKELSRALRWNISTCYHVLNTLEAEGYAVRDAATTAFRLGPSVGRLAQGYSARFAVLPAVRPVVVELARVTSENAYVAVREAREIVIADIVESTQRVRVERLHPGYGENIHARALGKAVLAHLPWSEARSQFLSEELPKLTPSTKTDLEAIRSELETTRARGYSLDLEEFCEGVCCVGAPIFGAQGAVVGAVSVSVPTYRFEPSQAALIRAVRDAARQATRQLGGDLAALALA
ncbi:MAG TPA: IclR family transcriptional regulator [Candidatus Dormibacteraeota bacterium]|nr:IclR family transcriptional regulator [Candidatus Dormibacteraeota bacterium]